MNETVLVSSDLITNKLITDGLGDLRKENELNKAIIAGKKEEFLLNQAVEDKVKRMGLLMKDLIKPDYTMIIPAVQQERPWIYI